MKQKIIFFLWLSSFFITSAFSQKNNVVKDTKQTLLPILAKTSCDCNATVSIAVSKNTKYGLTAPPIGSGKLMEIQANSNSPKHVFEEEHNTAWYQLNIEHDGELVYDIIPQDTANDYDFLLYKIKDNVFCSDLLNNKVVPLRGNLSRNELKTRGITGLSSKAQNSFSAKGAGDNYSHSMDVKQGEKYMLVLDNVYPNGNGHTIYFSYMIQINIQGTVGDFAKQPIAAEVSLMDEKNNCIAKTNTDAVTGKYNLTATIKENSFYSVIYTNPAYFPESAYINSRLLQQNEKTFNIDKLLAGLKVGETYTLTHYGDREQSFILYEEWPPLFILGVLMQKNPTMKIRVEVHAEESEIKRWENSDWGNNSTRVSLPKWRANNFKAELRYHGISLDRMQITTSDKMIVSKPKTEEDRKKNRAITLTILSK